MGQFKFFDKKSGTFQLLWSVGSFLILFVLPSHGFRSVDAEFPDLEKIDVVPVPVGYSPAAQSNGQIPLKTIPVLPQYPNVFQKILAKYQKHHKNQNQEQDEDHEVKTKPNVFQKVLAKYQKNHRNEQDEDREVKTKPNIFKKLLANYQKNHRDEQVEDEEREVERKPNVFQKVLAKYQKNHRNQHEEEKEDEEEEHETETKPNVFQRALSNYKINKRNEEIIKAYERQVDSPDAFLRALSRYTISQLKKEKHEESSEEEEEAKSNVSPNIFQKALSNYKKGQSQSQIKKNVMKNDQVIVVVPPKAKENNFEDAIVYYNQGVFKKHDMRNGKQILGEKQRKLKKLRMAKQLQHQHHHKQEEQESPVSTLKIRHARRFNTGDNEHELGTHSDINEDGQHGQPKSVQKPQKIKKNTPAEYYDKTSRLKRKSEDGEPESEPEPLPEPEYNQDNRMSDISGETPVFVDVNSELNKYHPLKELRKAQYALDKEERKLFEHNLFMEKVLHRRKLVRG